MQLSAVISQQENRNRQFPRTAELRLKLGLSLGQIVPPLLCPLKVVRVNGTERAEVIYELKRGRFGKKRLLVFKTVALAVPPERLAVGQVVLVLGAKYGVAHAGLQKMRGITTFIKAVLCY